MAYTYLSMYSGTLTTTSTTVYTTTVSTVAKEAIITNTNSSAINAYIKLGSAVLWPTKSVSANQSYVIPLNTHLAASAAIVAYASVASSIDIHLSGF
ncbi:MAG: hypothetical protein PHE17_21665, partial [Thiothrix sp.]|uniref:hypothetical protein n=1 Tax=Thiothrix sp. TaxID=1032 RepID=UPI0026338DCC